MEVEGKKHLFLKNICSGGIPGHGIEMDDIEIVQHLPALVLQRTREDIPVLVSPTQYFLPATRRLNFR